MLFPLFKLKSSYYNVNAKTRFTSSPLNVPSRTKRVWIGLIFDWLLILAMFGISQWWASLESLNRSREIGCLSKKYIPIPANLTLNLSHQVLFGSWATYSLFPRRRCWLYASAGSRNSIFRCRRFLFWRRTIDYFTYSRISVLLEQMEPLSFGHWACD